MDPKMSPKMASKMDLKMELKLGSKIALGQRGSIFWGVHFEQKQLNFS